MGITKDTRCNYLAALEKEILGRVKRKDGTFSLKGRWKKFVRVQRGVRVYTVDGEWVRNNLSVIFGHGGHGFVHEFIPINEVWVSGRHSGRSSFSRCGCKGAKDGQKVSNGFFESTVIHEVTELNEMKKGKPYWIAHKIANAAENKAGLVKIKNNIAYEN